MSLVGSTSLDTSTHPYARMYEASYYLNIIANETYAEWKDLVKELKAKALKPVSYTHLTLPTILRV